MALACARFRFRKRIHVTPRGATPRRVAAAERALRKERERLPLFAEQVATEQPTPCEWIAGVDVGLLQSEQHRRNLDARLWRECRRRLASLPQDERQQLLQLWNQATCPAIPAMLSWYLDHCLADVRRRIAAGERWFVFQIRDTSGSIHYRVLLWFPSTAPPAVAGPFEKFSEARAVIGTKR